MSELGDKDGFPLELREELREMSIGQLMDYLDADEYDEVRSEVMSAK